MKKTVLLLFGIALLFPKFQLGAEPIADEALLCADQADNYIRLISNDKTIWSYPAKENEDFPWRPTDAKRVEFNGETHILIAWHGRIRLVRFRDHKTVKDFKTYSSCHSAELLPDGTLVSASSNHGKLRVHFGKEDFHDLDLPYAHGVVWDKSRNRLWALGDFLYLIRYSDKKLTVEKQFKLPKSPTGHDLFPLQNEDRLLVSNNHGLYLFDIESKKFETVSELKWIKSASQRNDGSIWITDPANIEGAKSWQTDSVMQIQPKAPEKRFSFENARFYKARWWQKSTFSY